MKCNLGSIARWAAATLLWPLLLLAASVQAQDVGDADVEDAAVAVDVIVAIDKESRTITLKKGDGEQWVFTAGPEVRNFDQLKRGDLVILQYYAGLAIDLEPEGSGLKERVDQLALQRAAPGDKPGIQITGSTYAAAQVTAVDTKHRTVTLEGARGTLVLKVGDDVDLEKIKAGMQVEALYQESYAISVEPAPKVSGTLSMEITAVAIGVGIQWGDGTLSMYDGTSHPFKVKGLTLVDIGVSGVEMTGEVYNLVEAKDLEGTFLAAEAGAALVGGGSAMIMKNGNGVVLKLKSSQQGVRLTLAGEGLKISLK